MAESERKVLQRTLKIPPSITGEMTGCPRSSLRLCLLGCEDNPPYGPTESTAALFLETVCNAIMSSFGANGSNKMIDFEVSITIYRVQIQDYPVSVAEWDSYDGVIIPGSFSSAYETTDWIEKLKEVIQDEIHAKKRKTLAVCFGHQVYSHSFKGSKGGLCAPCPAGHQVGRRSSIPTKEGLALLRPALADQDENIVLMYTHGDMVAELPPCAVSLFGNDKVHIQAAAYFAGDEEAQIFREQCASEGPIENELPKPHAYTFQAHPEYACKDGLEVTFSNILTALGERQALPTSELFEAKIDTKRHFPSMQKQSISLMVHVGRSLGWFQ